MTYEQTDFTTPLIEFIKTCPFLVEHAEVEPMTLSANMISEGNALAYQGTGKPSWVQDIDGTIRSTKQANFAFFIRRPVNDVKFKLDAANFLQNFESWVEFEDIFGNPPRFGAEDYDERIWADNGTFWQEAKHPDAVDYVILIHIAYQLIYREE